MRPLALNLTASPVFIKRDYGNTAIVRESDGSLYLNQRVARLRCREKAVPKFLLYWLQTDSFREFFFAGETGNVNQGNVGAEGIRKAPIPLPSLAEQQEIVRRVEALFRFADQIEARYQKAKGQVDKLTQSILAKAFKGELVPTEAELARREGRDYEPASALLERIGKARSDSAAASNIAKANRLQERRLNRPAGRHR